MVAGFFAGVAVDAFVFGNVSKTFGFSGLYRGENTRAKRMPASGGLAWHRNARILGVMQPEDLKMHQVRAGTFDVSAWPSFEPTMK